MTTFNKKEFGTLGETAACRFIEDSGFIILERNYRNSRYGEIDIIARKEDLIVFFEVKTRRSMVYGGALYSMSPSRRKRFIAVARHYISTRGWASQKDLVYRYDMIALENGEINWVEDMFR
jgi:putative endonuclease